MTYPRPHEIFTPRVFLDGNMWCALYGENLQIAATAISGKWRKA